MPGGHVVHIKLFFFPDFKMANILRIFFFFFLPYLEVVVAPKNIYYFDLWKNMENLQCIIVSYGPLSAYCQR